MRSRVTGYESPVTGYPLPVTRYARRRLSRQAGSLSEGLALPWAFLYAWAGWLWGGMIGWAWLGAIVGFFVGAVIGFMMGAALLFEVTGLAVLLALAAWLLVPRPWLPHAAAAICALPLACCLFLSARGAVRDARARRIVAGTDTPEALVPHLASTEDAVRTAAIGPLVRLNLKPVERARVIVDVATRLKHDSYADRLWINQLAAPVARELPAPREALLLLYEHLGWVSAGRGTDPENADAWVQRALFERVEWGNDTPLRRASQARITQGWNVDRMVARLLETDSEAGGRMAEDAFSAGALGPALLLRLGEARAAAVIEREIARAANAKIGEYDRIVEAALGLPPGRALPLLERVLEWDPADYCIERALEQGLMKNAQPALAERCARAPDDAARFLAAVRARIARLERYDWNARVNTGWHPKARLDMWSALAGALEAGGR
jgi:hypothetical protein